MRTSIVISVYQLTRSKSPTVGAYCHVMMILSASRRTPPHSCQFSKVPAGTLMLLSYPIDCGPSCLIFRHNLDIYFLPSGTPELLNYLASPTTNAKKTILRLTSTIHFVPRTLRSRHRLPVEGRQCFQE